MATKKPAAKKALPVKKTSAKKPPAKKAAVAKPKAKPAAKKAAAKPVAKKAAPKKSVLKKSAPEKAAPKKIAVAKSKKPLVKKTVAPQQPAGIPELIRDAALKILDERQAEDIVTADLRGKSPLADYAIVATGRSGRQLAAIADYLRQACEKIAGRHPRIEGLQQGDWVLVDTGDVIVHLFRPEVRTYYRIEDIWSKRSPV